MLMVKLIDDTKKTVAEVQPLSLTLDLSLSAPAHSAVIIIPYRKLSSCAMVEVYDDEFSVFCGITDEEIVILGKEGRLIKLTARSMMALLIDNEVCPCEFVFPTGEYLGYRYLSPYGIEFSAEKKRLNGNITVEKGMSVYEVLYKYCKQALGTLPFVSADGKFDFYGGVSEKSVVFGKSGKQYTTLKLNSKRCNMISTVFLKLSEKGYCSKVINPFADGTLIRRERYIDATFGSATPSVIADYMIENSVRQSLSAEVGCVGRVTDCLGAAAVVEDEAFEGERFTVNRIKYTYNSNEEKTVLYLERRI
ncbi:MAG: hypothetical protein IJV39_05800 [Ruminococcus sp.]|nr:hypothetical protein [Ruminococcus sp.]